MPYDQTGVYYNPYAEEDEEQCPRCGRYDDIKYFECGVCGYCADELVDAAQERQLRREREQLEAM